MESNGVTIPFWGCYCPGNAGKQQNGEKTRTCPLWFYLHFSYQDYCILGSQLLHFFHAIHSKLGLKPPQGAAISYTSCISFISPHLLKATTQRNFINTYWVSK